MNNTVEDDIDEAADRVMELSDDDATVALGARLVEAHGAARNSDSMMALAALVAALINRSPAERRDYLVSVFMRLVQRMLDD